MIIRDDIQRMDGYVPGEQPQNGSYIKLNTNENPYPVSEKVIKAINTSAGELNRYSDPLSNKLRMSAAKLYGLNKEQVIAGNGSDDILNIIVRTCTSSNDTIASFTPSYTLYETLANIQGTNYKLFEFTKDYKIPNEIDLTGIKLFFLPNPNSPSGTVVGHDEIRLLCRKIDGVVVVDEAYADFAEENAISLISEFDNIIVTRTFSKSYSLAGLRVGLGLANEFLIKNMMKVKDSYNLGVLPIEAATAAIEDQTNLQKNITMIKATRNRLTTELENLGCFVFPSQANFVLVKFTKGIAKKIYRQLKEKNIFVRYFSTPRLSDCLRISIGTDDEINRLLAEIKLSLN